MTITPDLHFTRQLAADLRSFLSLCEEALTLGTCENQSLADNTNYRPQEFLHRRKSLLSGLDAALMSLKKQRVAWQQFDQADRQHSDEIKSLFQTVQGVLMKLLLLDRENQQALLRRGLVPTQHLPAAAAQHPNFVTSLYRRHSMP